MKKLISALIFALATTGAHAETITIAIDKSGSNPLLTDKYFAAAAAGYAGKLIGGLKDGDVVRLKSFGARSNASNMLDQRFVISRRLRANVLAESIQNYIRALPGKNDEAQRATNIVALLEFDNSFSCESDSKVLLLTDGLEASSVIDPMAFLEGKASLPKPDVDLAGCEVIFYGLGAGLPNSSVKHIRGEWQSYVTAAGATYTAIIK